LQYNSGAQYGGKEIGLKNKKLLFSISGLILLSSACSGQILTDYTVTAKPVFTETQAPSPTITPAPTQTATSQPVSLTGTIYIANGEIEPFVSTVELRRKDSFSLVGSGDTDSNGRFRIDDLNPGSYELWILITVDKVMIAGCKDVAPPDDRWKLGIKFGDDKAITMENTYLSKALLLVENLQGSDLVAQGFFAVLDDFELTSGIENSVDVTLVCK
jgi:hypothetical protein